VSLPPPDYFTARTIGTGQSNPGDVRRLRSTLKRTGHGRFPGQGAPNVTPGLMEAIKRFQTDFGLEPDAVIRPGGPTERALSMALHARNRQGPAAMDALRDTFAQRSRAGLTFQPHPRDRNAGQWVDATGRTLTDAQADAFAARPGQQLAMMRRDQQLRKPGQNLLEGGGGLMPSRGGLGEGLTLGGIINYLQGAKPQKEAPDGLPIEKPRGAARTVPLKNPDSRTPPSPAQPPGNMENSEEYPAQERRPFVTVSPVPEERRPQIEIFPGLSDAIEQWILLENSRGLEKQKKTVQLIIDKIDKRAKEEKIDEYYEHTHGGYSAPDEEGNRQYMKERVIRVGKEWPKGHKRSDYSAVFGGVREDINVVDTLKDGRAPDARERRNIEAINALKDILGEMSPIRWIGKKKNGMTDEEHEAEIDELVEELVRKWKIQAQNLKRRSHNK
jgi:hypothetical protein